MTLVLLLIASYLLGNLLTARFLGAIFYKRSIITEGSGNPGARNAGRVLGRKAFVATFLGDALKGALAVLATKWLGFDFSIQIIALLAVLLGHIYPIFFKFKGGQGISAFIGGLIALHLPLLGVFVALFLILYVINRSFTMAGLTAITAVPILMLFFSLGCLPSIIMCLVSGLLLFAHRHDLKEKYMKRRGTII